MPLSVEQKAIVDDALIYGAVGTAVSVPLMLWLVPASRARDWPGWAIPVALTAIGLATKLVVHHYLESPGLVVRP